MLTHCVQADVTGVTLSSEQVAWATEVASRQGVQCPNFLRMDYRDIPFRKYDKITCLEMAEHVGVKNFSKFLVQVRELERLNHVTLMVSLCCRWC